MSVPILDPFAAGTLPAIGDWPLKDGTRPFQGERMPSRSSRIPHSIDIAAGKSVTESAERERVDLVVDVKAARRACGSDCERPRRAFRKRPSAAPDQHAAEAQETPDSYGEHGIAADGGMIPIDRIEAAKTRMSEGDADVPLRP